VNSGSSYVLKADFLDPASTYSWTSIPAGFASTSATATVSPLPVVTTTYMVTAKSPLGCSMSDAVVITINPQPTLSVNAPSACLGVSASLSGSGAVTYSWSPATGLSTTTGASTIATISTTGNYTLTGSNALGCTNSISTTVTIFSLPTVTSTSSSICKGGSTTLSASGASTYSWSPSTGLNNNTANPVNVSLNTLGLTTYTLTGISAQGCTATTTATVDVYNCLLVKAQDTTLCEGYCAILKAVASTGVPNYTYTWSGGLADLSSVCPIVTTDYTVTATDANGNTASDILTVTIEKTPVITVAPVSICLGNCASLTASGASTYTWSPAMGLNTTTGSTVSACNLSTSQTYTVNGSTVAGCTNSTTVTVTVNPLPTLTSLPATICKGTTTTLSVNGANTYTWTPITGLSSSTGANITATPTITTTYTIAGADNNGCTATTQVTVNVNAIPTISAGPAQTICAGTNAVLSTSGATTYTWSTGTNTTSITVNPLVKTTYSVTGETAGCTHTASVAVDVKNCVFVTTRDTLLCQGYCAVLASSAGGGIGPYTYSWNGGTVTNGSNGQLVCPPTTTTYTVIATDVGTGGQGTATMVVKIDPLPAVTVANQSICVNQSVSLTANGASTYSWSPATGLNTTFGNIVIASPTITSTYTIQAHSLAGCTGTTTVTVTVNPLPTISANPATICSGGNAQLSASGATSYTWLPIASVTPNPGNPVNTKPTSTATYTVVGKDANGCINSSTVAVTVYPNPTITVNNASICLGESAGLTASGANTYNWTPATFLSQTSGSSVVSKPTTTTNYVVTGTDNYGCSGTTTAKVFVYPLTTVTAISKQICLNQSTPLTVSGAANYSWTPASGLNPTTGANVIANPTTTTIYTISATSLYNCTATTTVQVTVNPIPTIVASTDTICEGQYGDLTASGANTYTWQPTGYTGSNTTDLPFVSTTYTVTGTSIYGCTQTSTAFIYVKTYPNVDFDVNPGTASIYEAKINFTNLTTPKDNKYVWLFGDDSTSTLEHPVHIYGDTGKYKVCLFADKDGCIRELCKPVIIIPEWTFYVPNAFTPNGDKYNEGFIGVGTYIKTYEMWIFDRWGNLIYHCRDMDKPWNGRVNNGINGEEVAQQDVYIWKIKITDVFDKKHAYLGPVTIVK
jgi:gliding motility-associated-like protein